MKATNPTALIILDGFGYRSEKKYNAIAHAHMPNFNQWWNTYPHAILQAAGTFVGLPDHMIGNSEVGHITIGAGRIIPQPITLWLESIDDGTFMHNPVLIKKLELLHSAGGALHIVGLLSDAGVHGHETTMYAVIDVAVKMGIKKIIVHAILDGRDVAAQSARHYLQHLAQVTKQYNHGQTIIGSVHGRFYAMDRDHNWDRIEKSYRVLTEKQHEPYETWERVLECNYMHGVTDEFVVPTQLTEQAIMHNGDGVLFCNTRPDRARELTACFLQNGFSHFILKPLNLTFFITPVEYDKHVPTTVLFPRKVVLHTLKDVLAQHDKTIFTIAETEKYAHVTYFFRGENEDAVSTESRHMIRSIVTKNYVAHPEMRAEEITQTVIASLEKNPADFYLINYANADMVGHSGNSGATIQAVEILDKQLGRLYELFVEKMDGTMYITADHGKAEDMFDEVMNEPRTAHTNNPVPYIMLKKGLKNSLLPLQELSDIAPFILRNMGIDVPVEMQKK